MRRVARASAPDLLAPVRAGRETIAFAVVDDRFEVFIDGAPALEAGRVLAALGSPPPWLSVIDEVEAVVRRCPDAPARDLLLHLASSDADRLRRLSEHDGPVPLWLCWAGAVDRSSFVRRGWAMHVPLDGTRDEAALHLFFAHQQMTPLLRQRFGSDVDAQEWAALLGDDRVLRILVRGHATAGSVTSEEMLVEVARLYKTTREDLLLTLLNNTEARGVAEALVDCPFAAVRAAVAGYSAAPVEVWRRLQADPVRAIAEAAWRREYDEHWSDTFRHRSPAYAAFARKFEAWRAEPYALRNLS